MCRSLSGADYSSWIIVPTENFSIESGVDHISDYQASEHFARSFCNNCGSTVKCVNDDKFPGHTYVAKGNVVSDFDIPAQIQVFTEFKASWVKLDDTIPVFEVKK